MHKQLLSPIVSIGAGGDRNAVWLWVLKVNPGKPVLENWFSMMCNE